MTDPKHTDTPGSELAKDFRAVAAHQVAELGWGYSAGRGRGGHAALYPTDKTKGPIVIAGTSGGGRALANFIAQVRRSGGEWPASGQR